MTDDQFKDGWHSPETTTDFHLGDYWAMVRRHWRLIAVTSVVCLLAGAVHFIVTPLEFQASTTIQIERRALTSLTGDTNPWLESYWNMEFYPTQYRLLQSRGLAERVVTNLDLVNDPEFNTAVAGQEGSPVADDAATVGMLAGKLLGGLSVNPVRNTQLVDISYRSSSPELAAEVANGVAEAFIEWGIYTRSETAANASTFLSSQIEDVAQSLEQTERDLQSYSRTTDLVAVDPESNDTLQRLEGLNRNYSAATSERITKEAFYQGLMTTDKQSVADSISGGLVSQQLEEIARLEAEYNANLEVYKPDWPEMMSLSAQIDQRRRSLGQTVDKTVEQARSAARTDYLTALRKEESLKKELDALRQEAIELHSVTAEFNSLELEATSKRVLLGDLKRRQSETELAARMRTTRESNVRVVDKALVPGAPFRPSLRNDLTFGLGLGLALGLGLVLLIEYLDRSLKTSEQVEKLLGVPTLAVIPDISAGGSRYGYAGRYGYGYGTAGRRAAAEGADGEETDDRIELLPISRPKLAVSEAYRALRTALLLSTANELKVIAMTSANAGEGKTATSTNLAVVLAQLGKRVLLIDGDLRKPRLHEVFQRTNRTGLVTYLTTDVEPGEIFLETEVPNLHLTPSGPIPPNPSELLSSQRMEQLLTACRELYDFLIIDTPPTLAVTDSTLIGAMADGVVLCLQAGRVLREEAKSCHERLRLADVRVLGTVLNRYRRGSSKHYRGYLYQSYPYAADDALSDSAA